MDHTNRMGIVGALVCAANIAWSSGCGAPGAPSDPSPSPRTFESSVQVSVSLRSEGSGGPEVPADADGVYVLPTDVPNGVFLNVVRKRRTERCIWVDVTPGWSEPMRGCLPESMADSASAGFGLTIPPGPPGTIHVVSVVVEERDGDLPAPMRLVSERFRVRIR